MRDWLFVFFLLAMLIGVWVSLYGGQEKIGIVVAWLSLGCMLFFIY
jgi:hypothetical protein